MENGRKGSYIPSGRRGARPLKPTSLRTLRCKKDYICRLYALIIKTTCASMAIDDPGDDDRSTRKSAVIVFTLFTGRRAFRRVARAFSRKGEQEEHKI